MRSPAAAIAWELGRRHLWGWAALAAYLMALAAVKFLVLGAGQRTAYDQEWQFALMVIVPLSAIFMYFLAVFSYGLEGDLAQRRSMYPARMFVRPVSSAALAGWPMLYGAAVMALTWLMTRLLAVWPAEAEIPRLWPALFASAVLVGLAVSLIIVIGLSISIWIYVGQFRSKGFGLVPGTTPKRRRRNPLDVIAGAPKPTVEKSLVPWLNDCLNALAGLPDDQVLRFGHLWAGLDYEEKRLDTTSA